MQQQRILFITLLSLVTLVFFGLLSVIFFPIFWAVVFSILCAPVYKYIVSYIRHETLSALLTILLTLVCIVAPLALLSIVLTNEARTAYNTLNGTTTIQGYTLIEHAKVWIAKLEPLGIRTESLTETVTNTAKTASASIAQNAVSLGRATAQTLFSVFIMLYVFFFLLRDGARIGEALKRAFPLHNDDEQFLFNRFSEMTRAMFKGTLIVALVQGLLGGALFAIAGISSPLLWATVMTVLAVIPGVGPALVWLPAGALLLASGAVFPATVVLVGGVTLISYADNVLRPLLIGRDTNMPDVLIFISVVAGLSVFGITGLVIGPALAALTMAFWELYARA